MVVSSDHPYTRLECGLEVCNCEASLAQESFHITHLETTPPVYMRLVQN